MEEYLKKINVKHRIRDPIYGFIHLTEAEREVIDTPLFQRLRRVHQLALTKYVYPSAEHSRFVHSLGVMHCATHLLSGIIGNRNTDTTFQDPSLKILKTLRYASLLHDIGHLPFSHAVEKHWLNGLKHEHLSRYIIENDKAISGIIRMDGVEPKEVSSLLAKTWPVRLRLFHEIISGQLDADRADYLLRDAHFCGAKYSEYDFARFLEIFAAREDENGALTLCINEKDIYVAESFLIARYHYNMQIPYHKTRVGYDIVLKRYIQDFDEFKDLFDVQDGELKKVDLERLEDLDDYTIIQHVKCQNRKENFWAPYLLRSKHLIPILDISSMSKRGVLLFKSFVRQLEEADALKKDDDFFVYEQRVELLKWDNTSEKEFVAPDVLDESRGPVQGHITLSSSEGKGRPVGYVDICDRSWIFCELATAPPSIYRVYVTPEKESVARGILNQLNKGEKEAHHV